VQYKRKDNSKERENIILYSPPDSFISGEVHCLFGSHEKAPHQYRHALMLTVMAFKQDLLFNPF